MFFKEKKFSFSIRKFSIGVASAIVGISLIGGTIAAAPVAAESHLTNPIGSKSIQYKYVVESDLTDEEKLRIQEELPTYQVGDYDTYYMVYRPQQSLLPSTGSQKTNLLLASAGAGLLVLGVTRLKRKKSVVSAIMIIGATSTISVSAISSGVLSHHDKSYELAIGSIIPETKITIDRYEFVGYILDKASDRLPQGATQGDDLHSLAEGTDKASESLNNEKVESPASEGTLEVSTSEVPQSETISQSEVLPEVTTSQASLPYETIFQADPQLEQGTEEVVQAGQNGLKVLTYHDGQLIKEEVTVSPVAQIIRRGTKVAEPETSTSTVISESVSMSTSVVTSLVTSTTTVTSTSIVSSDSDSVSTSEVVSESVVTSEVTSEVDVPVIVPVESTISTEISVAPSESDEATPLPSEEIVISETSVEESVSNSQSVSEVISTSTSTSEILEQPTPETPIEASETVEVRESIPSPIIRQEDETLWEGETNELKGTDGEKLVKTTYKTLDGVRQPNPTVTEEIVQAATPTIIKVGTKPIEGTVSESSERSIPFEIRYEDDPTALVGTQKIKQEGIDGLERVTLTYNTIKGTKEGKPVEKIEIIVPATPEIILRGTKVETEADRQTPLVTSNKQVVKVGERPDPKASIQSNLLANVADYVWVTEPATDKVGVDLPGRVRVIYTDNSVDDVDVRIDVVTQKEKPLLTYESFIENDDEKKISLDYALEDPTKSYIGATISIYDGEKLVKSLPLSTMEAFDVTDLDWHVKYTLKTQYSYDLEDGQGVQIEHLADREFELDYKRLEIKHVVSAGLFQKQADGSYLQLDNVSQVAANLNDYYVRVVSDQQRDIYLPVTDMVEDTYDGKPVFKVTTSIPELIQYDQAIADNKANYSFYIRKFVPSSDGKYRTFSDLITAIKNNMSGTFEIDADLNADEIVLDANATSYIPGTFTGRLLGNNNAILNLKAPLFEFLQGSFEIKDLDLKKVNIQKPNMEQFGALAKIANGDNVGKISNVAVEGTLSGNRHIGGIIYRANRTVLENVAFEGSIISPLNWSHNFTGGIAGYLRESRLSKAKVDATIRSDSRSFLGKIGGIVGVMENAGTSLTDVVATGSIDNSQGNTSGHVGGLVGDTIGNVSITNAVSSVNVRNGQIGHGNPSTNTAHDRIDIQTVEGLAKGTDNNLSTTISQEEAANKVEAMNLTVTLDDSAIDYSRYNVDYSTVKQAKAENMLAYQNLEKFMPLYNKEFIVKHGNQLPSNHELATKPIISVIPMIGDDFASDYANDKASINRVMVYFEDGSKAYYNVSYLADFKNTGVAEYQVEGFDFVYTPEQIMTVYPKIVDAVLPTLSAIEYYSEDLLNALGKSGNTQELMDKLYLKESFDNIKQNLATVLNSVLATSDVLAADRTDISDYILRHKEALLMGLSYVNRWYNIDFGDVNAKELILYHQDLFGNSTNTLEWLVSIGKTYEQLQMINHLATYESTTRAHTGQDSEFDYLSVYRKLFTDMDENTWFHDASQVYMVEGASEVRPDVDVRAYQKLYNDPEARKYILPLLTADEGIFFISNMSTINFGMYDRYMDMSLKETDPVKYAEEVKRVEAMVDAANKRYADHFDFWYRMSLDSVKELNIKTVPNWDGYYLNRTGLNQNEWLPMYGSEANEAIQDFFGPLDGSLGSHYVGNGSGAYATGNLTRFVIDKMLENYGSSVHTHEMVHNSDASIYLGGYGRRFGQRAELYATGLLQAPTGHDSSYLSINTLFDYTGTDYEEATNRYQPLSPERFETAADLQEYFHGLFDVIYTLDYAEAEVILAMDKDQQRQFYNKIENYYVQDAVSKEDTHAGNVVRKFTDEEWNNMTLSSVYDLIENDVISHRDYSINSGTSYQYGRNGYYTISLFSPIYSALDNPKGAPGDLMFRLMAYELLAAKGYEDGFLPYVSDQLADEALKQGITGTETWPSNHTVGRVTDDLVFEKVFNGEYASWKEFKKAMYQERIDKVDQLKSVTINFNGQDVVIDSIDKIKDLMEVAIAEDTRRFLTINENTNIARNNSFYAQNSKVKELKAKIFNAYLRQTNDFRDSIYF